MKHVIDHIDHIVKVAGINHVGIGCDFDGGGGIEGVFDASEVMNITIELVKRGYSEEEIQKNLGRKFNPCLQGGTSCCKADTNKSIFLGHKLYGNIQIFGIPNHNLRTIGVRCGSPFEAILM